MVRTHTSNELTDLNLGRFKYPRYDVNARGVLTRYVSIMKKDTLYYESLRKQIVRHKLRMTFVEQDQVENGVSSRQ